MNNISNVNLVGITGVARRMVLDGALDETLARKYINEAIQAKKPFHIYLREKELCDSKSVIQACSLEFGHPYVDLKNITIDDNAFKLVEEEVMNKENLIPILKRGNHLYIATSDPTNTSPLDKIKFKTNLVIEALLCEYETIKTVIENQINKSSSFTDAMNMDEDIDLASTSDDGDDQPSTGNNIEGSENEGPVVKFINNVLLDSIRRGASDIHFEPYELEYRVRFRIDGVLKTVAKAPIKLSQRLSARLKVMSSLDIAEKRLPQDGRIKLNITKTKQMDFRVSTCPTLFGEKIVLRMLDGGAAKLGIDKLGYEDDQKELYLKALSNPYGMILVTGPTGSGKTVSLYTGLNILNTDERNISTAEDPVEIRVPGINQVQMNPKKGMTFAAALKSFLRQDPDVIMVGEIRDLETAEIAVKAAQTGHLVLSTLHTNDAPQTISRLMNMGIAGYNITSSVSLIIAQRLARRLCPHCRKPVQLPVQSLKEIGFTDEQITKGITIYEAVGCDKCTDGYKGRVGIYQVMPMLEAIQKIILEGGTSMQIAEVCKKEGIRDLRESALRKVIEGSLSIQEADRVTIA